MAFEKTSVIDMTKGCLGHTLLARLAGSSFDQAKPIQWKISKNM